MRLWIISLLILGCNTSDFHSSVASQDRYSSDAHALSGITAEGLNYIGDPIVLKDPPADNFASYPYTTVNEWQTNIVRAHYGSQELYGTRRREKITIARSTAIMHVPSISQVSRESYQFIRKQPGQASTGSESESFTQADRGILDILLAIDNSGSMGGYISNVRNNLKSLLTHVGSSNWQIAMVKSDPHNTCATEGLITAATSNYANAYKQLLSFNLEGGTEHLLKKARWALEGKSGTHCDGSWLRSNSTVAVIVVSDEPHQCPDSNYCSPSAYSNFVNSFAHTIKTYGFTGWNSTDQSVFDAHAVITNSDYASTLQSISSDIQVSLKDIFTLQRTPDGNLITVTVNGNTVPTCTKPRQATGCFEVITTTNSSGSNSAVQFFNYKPPQSATINIDYSYGAIAFVTSWTLDHEPLPAVDAMTVTVTKADGTSTTLTRGTDYTLNGKTLTVSSTSVVPQGATMTVDYLENKAQLTKFSLASKYQVASTALVANTALVTIRDGNSKVIKTLKRGFIFNGATLTFTLSTHMPLAGVTGKSKPQQFTLAYEYYPYTEKLKLQYDFTQHQDHRAGSVLRCHNSTQNIAVDCTYDDSTQILSFTNSSQLAEGDIVTIEEDLHQQGNTISLRDSGWLLDEGVQLELQSTSCSVPSRFISNDIIMLAEMDVDDCAVMQHLQADVKQMVDYSYKVYADEAEDFLQMDSDFFATHRGYYKFEYWEVLIDDERTNKFTVDNYRVVFADDVQLGKNATVKVTVRLYHAL